MWHCLDKINDISSFFASMYLCVTHHLLLLNIHRNETYFLKFLAKRYLEYDTSNDIVLSLYTYSNFVTRLNEEIVMEYELEAKHILVV